MTQPPPLIDALRRLAGSGPDARSDAELLADFVARRDPGAFAALVQRHGRLVWGACRRRARDSHAAEDAFQTTFLALARHAAAVRKPEAVGAWLHRVAVRCTAATRTPREPMSALPEDLPTPATGPAAAAAGRDLERAIDAEIDALPEPFRLTFVMCEVEERSTAEAARALGCPVGTVESRLTRARERLRARLARRGITAGALVGLGLAADAVPASARAAALALGTGAAPVPLARAALADRAARTPVAGATVAGLGIASSVLLVGVGGLVWALTGPADRPDRPDPAAPHHARTLPAPELEIPEAEQFRRNRENFPLPPEAIARVGDAWLRHAGSPDRMAFSADGRFLASGAVGDRWLRVWDLTARRPRAHLRLGPGEVPLALALTPDGGVLRAVVQAGDATHLREYDTFRALETHRRPLARPAAVAFDAAGGLLALAVPGEVRLLDAATAVERWRANVPGVEAVEVAFAADRLAVAGTGSDRVRLYGLGTGTPADELVEAGSQVTLPTVSADGRTLAVWLPLQNRVRIWDVPGRRVVRTIDLPFPPIGLALAPDGSRVAVFTEWSMGTLWATRAAGKPRPLGLTFSHTGRFSADGSLLAVSTVQRATYDTQHGVIQLLDPETGRPTALSPAEPDAPVPLTFDSDGGHLLLQGMMRWLDYPTSGDGQPRAIAPGFGPKEKEPIAAEYRAALSPDHTLLARCTQVNPEKHEYVLDLIEVANRATRTSIPLEGLAQRPAFAPDGRTVYAVVAHHVCGWDVASGQPVFRSNQPVGELPYRLLVSADGRYLATALLVLAPVQRAGSIQVWDAATGDCVIAAEAGQGKPFIAFSADGKRFAAAAVPDRPAQHASEIRVWDLDSHRVAATFPGYDGQPAFSPDGRTVAVTREDAVVLIEFVTGQARHVFRHHGPVREQANLAWSPNGRVLAAASREAPVYLWDVVGDRTGPVPAWKAADNSRRWDALTGAAAEPAFGAVRELWTHPTEAAAFLKSRVPAGADARLASRACEALELPAAKAGKNLLQEWAAGPADAPRTHEAAAALKRLAAAGGGGRG